MEEGLCCGNLLDARVPLVPQTCAVFSWARGYRAVVSIQSLAWRCLFFEFVWSRAKISGGLRTGAIRLIAKEICAYFLKPRHILRATGCRAIRASRIQSPLLEGVGGGAASSGRPRRDRSAKRWSCCNPLKSRAIHLICPPLNPLPGGDLRRAAQPHLNQSRTAPVGLPIPAILFLAMSLDKFFGSVRGGEKRASRL